MMYHDTSEGFLYIGGNLYNVDGKSVNRLFRIDSNESVDYMDTIGINMDTPLDMIEFLDTVYHVGFSGINTFQNNSWVRNLSDEVFYSMEIYNGDLLISGLFQNAISSHDGVVIRYDGNQFYPFEDIYNVLGDTLNFGGGLVYDFQEYKGKIYMGGNFEAIHNGNYNEIISWDGSNWDNVNGGIPGTSGLEHVSKLIIYHNEMYVAGRYFKKSGSPSNNILKWDGNQWLALGNGIYGNGISDMIVFNDQLWVAGILDSVDNMPINNVVSWDGERWCTPKGKFGSEVTSFEVFKDTLFAAGSFVEIDGDTTRKYCVKLNSFVSDCGPLVNIIPLGIENDYYWQSDVRLYPNPNGGEFTIKMNHYGKIQLFVYNNFGRIVFESVIQHDLESIIKLPSHLPSGKYIVKIYYGNTSATSEMVIKK